MADLSIKISDVGFKNPVFTASGTFGYGSEVSDLYDVNLLGGVVTKTITRQPRAGNSPGRIAETTAGLLNSIGLANVGLDNFISDKLPYLKGLNTGIIVNVAGESIEDFVELITRLEAHDEIDGFELNLSCPNVSGGLDFSIDPKLAFKVIDRVKKVTKKLVIPKLTPNVTDITLIAKAVEDGGADAVSLINTLLGMAVDIKTKRPKLGNVMGGLSGPAIKPVALARVFSVSRKVKIPVIGIGGICSMEDVLEFLIAGASAVQLGTINFIDPMAPVKIISKLEDYFSNNKINSVSEIINTIQI
ncbi:MAG: dihydroorotate dehydrogenase [bacterium]|nr:dihydroorotate dehydrogenase [bacterium]